MVKHAVATSGLGRDTAIAAAAEGAKVVVSGRRVEQGQAVVDKIRAAGGEASFVRADMSSEEDIKNLVDKTVELYGRLDGAFNNAGVPSMESVFEITTGEIDRILDINLRGVILCTKYAALAMKNNGGGSILLQGSVAGIHEVLGVPFGVYGASKAGVMQFGRQVSKELARHNIRINTLNTGIFTDTDIWADMPPEAEAQFTAQVPIGRGGTNAEHASTAIFFLSDMSSYVSGTSLAMDGALTA